MEPNDEIIRGLFLVLVYAEQTRPDTQTISRLLKLQAERSTHDKTKQFFEEMAGSIGSNMTEVGRLFREREDRRVRQQTQF